MRSEEGARFPSTRGLVVSVGAAALGVVEGVTVRDVSLTFVVTEGCASRMGDRLLSIDGFPVSSVELDD